MPEILSTIWLGKPLWMWLGFHAFVFILLAFDLGVLSRSNAEMTFQRSLSLSAFYVALGLAYGVWVWFGISPRAGLEYLTGFVIEKSLSMDNIFVISAIFAYLATPKHYQYRVLFWGILAVVVLRGLMILGGAALIERFEWILWVFAVFLVGTGVKMLMRPNQGHDIGDNPMLGFLRRHLRMTETVDGPQFVVRRPHPVTGQPVLFATPLLLALALVNIVDVVFAIDSVPAIFAVTTDTFIVYTSNIFAILGLRALYFALANLVDRFRYLGTALALLLIFVGGKIIAADMLDIAKIPPALSLSVTLAILAGGVIASLVATRGQPADK